MKVRQIHDIEIADEARIAEEIDLARASGLLGSTRGRLMNEIMTQILLYGRQSGVLQFAADGRWFAEPVRDQTVVRFSVAWRLVNTTTTIV